MARIDALLDEALGRGASDLHLAAGAPPLVRVRGAIAALRDTPLDSKEVDEMCLEILPSRLQDRLTTELEVVFAHAHRDAARARVGIFAKHGGLGAVLRLVPARVPSLAELGCPEILWRLLDRRSGIVLVAGGAGSGRTTTAAAMVDHLNKTRSCHVLTLDEPVEYVHEPLRAQITQREIASHASSWSVAMRNALRENVDVVVLGDLREGEPTRLALELASSGVLVIAVVPANGAIASVERVLASFAKDEQARARCIFADCLVGVLAQQLVRTSDSKTRVPAFEVLVATPAVVGAVREGKVRDLSSLMQSGHAHGMQTFESALERLLAANRIAPDVAFQRAIDKEAFARVLGRLRPDLVEQSSS